MLGERTPSATSAFDALPPIDLVLLSHDYHDDHHDHHDRFDDATVRRVARRGAAVDPGARRDAARGVSAPAAHRWAPDPRQ